MKSFAPSSMPNQTITSGMSARCGTLRTICTLVSVAEKESRDRPFKRPSARPDPSADRKPREGAQRAHAEVLRQFA